ncbi:helix-turn-helix domain-containing protein [Acinetobacter soli]|uniref:helix-turn-helix domain-containing protein n=1 Tax=Acinetobacter soli TaxID=487316 RepID=UPI001F37DCA0|nr:helix-turn-helix domain-containing protein [Acinetobacter soli]MCE6007552.1 helix-turn-helix domain-containing protein [Acinetobacter soli]
MINQIELLEKLGISAFGNAWKASLADALPVARPTVTDWLSGKKPIPVGVWSDIQKILESRLMAMQGAIIEIKEQRHLIIVEEMKRKGKAYIDDAFSEYLYAMSDNEIMDLLSAYKEEFFKLSEKYPNDTFVDMSVIKDAIDFNYCIRDLNGNLDLSLAEDCALSYFNNMKTAKTFNLDENFMIERSKEILESKIALN